MATLTRQDLDRIKRQARELHQITGACISHCLEEIAKQKGFKTYAALCAAAFRGAAT